MVGRLSTRRVARVTFRPVDVPERQECFLAVTRDSALSAAMDLTGYAGILIEAGTDQPPVPQGVPVVAIRDGDCLTSISGDSIVAVNTDTGHLRVLYRPESRHNAIFVTQRCNSNCIMCSQPPVMSQDNTVLEEHLRLIDLIRQPPESLGITGGEPTLLEGGLVALLSRLRERFPDSHIQMLTNGRLYVNEGFVATIASVAPRYFISAIPLYSDVAVEHDYIVQARGAFDETLMGLYNAARQGLHVEIRVVLQQQTVPRLTRLAEFIYRNLPFVDHVALMGLENMGYAKKNWRLLWTDPGDYADCLERTVRHLFYRRMNVSIYNLQLCVLPRSLWGFARQSISDYKKIYLDECEGCSVRERCGGLFESCKTRHPRDIKAIQQGSLGNDRGQLVPQ